MARRRTLAWIPATACLILGVGGKAAAKDPARHETIRAELQVAGQDPGWSRFELYLRDVLVFVQQAYEAHLKHSGAPLPLGRSVAVVFVLDDRGEIERIERVVPSAGVPDPAVDSCVAAVAEGRPFPRWTGEMVQSLGKLQTMTLTFTTREVSVRPG